MACLPLPSIIIMFLVVPDVMRLSALMTSVTALDELVLSDTLAYMQVRQHYQAYTIYCIEHVCPA
jgi:hypothetical protein